MTETIKIDREDYYRTIVIHSHAEWQASALSSAMVTDQDLFISISEATVEALPMGMEHDVYSFTKNISKDVRQSIKVLNIAIVEGNHECPA